MLQLFSPGENMPHDLLWCKDSQTLRTAIVLQKTPRVDLLMILKNTPEVALLPVI